VTHLLCAVLLASSALAGSREDLKAAGEAVQKSPNDVALREKAIALARKVKPSPAVPREAERRMTRGAAAVESASGPVDFKAAAAEFEAAATAAPWWGDAYYNLAVAQDKAGEHAAALRSLKLAALAMPGSKDVQKLADAVEFRAEKAASGPDASALAGEWVDRARGGSRMYWKLAADEGVLRITGLGWDAGSGRETISEDSWGEYRLKPAPGGFEGVHVAGTQGMACEGRESPASAALSADGRQLTVTLKQVYDHPLIGRMVDPHRCVSIAPKEHKFTLHKL
jgi:hypothetical protein